MKKNDSMIGLAKRLFPINRSILGDGFKKSLSEIKKIGPFESNLIMIATIIIKGSKIIENNNPKKISTNLLNFFSFPEKKIKIK